MFNFGKSREIEEFAVALAREFSTRFPPGTRSAEAQRFARAVDEICNRARAFQREKKLGIYGRAKIGTSFKFELKNAGYPDEFIDSLTHQVLLVMSG
jgi:phosphoglycerate dehydrogenase-like enzyme